VTAGLSRSDNEGKYRSKNPVVRHLVAQFLRRVSDLVVAQRPRRVLEVGCGEGMVLSHLAARLPDARFDGLDHAFHTLLAYGPQAEVLAPREPSERIAATT